MMGKIWVLKIKIFAWCYVNSYKPFLNFFFLSRLAILVVCTMQEQWFLVNKCEICLFVECHE